MERQYYSLNQNFANAATADAIISREQEIFFYELNISNYEQMLTKLPTDEWPAHLSQYKHSTLDQVPDEFDQIVSDYQQRDRLKALLKTERLERNKSVMIYETLIERLPAEIRDSEIQAAIARVQARSQTPQ